MAKFSPREYAEFLDYLLNEERSKMLLERGAAPPFAITQADAATRAGGRKGLLASPLGGAIGAAPFSPRTSLMRAGAGPADGWKLERKPAGAYNAGGSAGVAASAGITSPAYRKPTLSNASETLALPELGFGGSSYAKPPHDMADDSLLGMGAYAKPPRVFAERGLGGRFDAVRPANTAPGLWRQPNAALLHASARTENASDVLEKIRTSRLPAGAPAASTEKARAAQERAQVLRDMLDAQQALASGRVATSVANAGITSSPPPPLSHRVWLQR